MDWLVAKLLHHSDALNQINSALIRTELSTCFATKCCQIRNYANYRAKCANVCIHEAHTEVLGSNSHITKERASPALSQKSCEQSLPFQLYNLSHLSELLNNPPISYLSVGSGLFTTSAYVYVTTVHKHILNTNNNNNNHSNNSLLNSLPAPNT
jgi:hypothetical protein